MAARLTARLTARGRLTILYTTLVLAAGLVLMALTYVLMRRNLEHRAFLVQVRPPADPGQAPAGGQGLPDIADQVRAATLAELPTQAAVALGAVALLAATLGWVVAGKVLRPIRAISTTAQRLSAENLSERVPVEAPADELTALAGTINGMLDRIQGGIAERDRVLEGQRMFAANAAHELRTPLTTMRTAVDVTLDGEPSRAELLAMAGDVRTAIGRSQRTLDGLLALARSQAGPGTYRPVDLADVVAGALEAAEGEAAARGVSVRADGGPAPVGGEPILLERMVGNLVDNAVRYNQAGGRVAVTTGLVDDRAFLRIANTGRRIAPGEVDHLLEPFVRGGDGRRRSDEGAGLGLSIVRAVVVAHGGELSAVPQPTGGLDATVRLPARTGQAEGTPGSATPAAGLL